MNMTDIVVSTLSDFLKDNRVNFKCLDLAIRVEDPKLEIELIPSSSGTEIETTDGKITICGDIENNYEVLLNRMFQLAENKISIRTFAEIKYDIWKRRDYSINGGPMICNVPSLGIYSDNRFIYRTKRLPIQMIQIERELMSVDPKEMTFLGYGIDSLKIHNAKIFNGVVICIGIHTNMHPVSGNLCMKESITGERLSGEVLTQGLFHKIMTMASVLNLDDCYDKERHIKRLEHFIK